MNDLELNKEVAIKVLGWKWVPLNEIPGCEAFRMLSGAGQWYNSLGEQEYLPSFLTNMEHAWSYLVEPLRGAWDIQSVSDGWYVRLSVPRGPYSDKIVSAHAKTAAEAICLAALKSVDS